MTKSFRPLAAKEQADLRTLAWVYLGIALPFTAFRLYVRRKNLWWDDLCSGLAVLALVAETAVMVMIGYGFSRRTNSDASISGKVALNYLNLILYLLEDWFARLSILYSIIRITPSIRHVRFLHYLAASFVICLLINSLLYVGYCEAHPSWKNKNRVVVVCVRPNSFPIFQVTTGIVSDAILVFLPINTLRILTCMPALRRLLMILFSSSMLMTIAQIAQAVLTLKVPGPASLLSTLTEGFVAVMVCSLTVVSIAIIQLASPSEAASLKRRRDPGFNISKELGFRTSFSDGQETSRGTDSSGPATLPRTLRIDHATEHKDGDIEDTRYLKERADINLTLTPREPPRRSSISSSTVYTSTFWERWKNVDVDADTNLLS